MINFSYVVSFVHTYICYTDYDGTLFNLYLDKVILIIELDTDFYVFKITFVNVNQCGNLNWNLSSLTHI